MFLHLWRHLRLKHLLLALHKLLKKNEFFLELGVSSALFIRPLAEAFPLMVVRQVEARNFSRVLLTRQSQDLVALDSGRSNRTAFEIAVVHLFRLSLLGHARIVNITFVVLEDEADEVLASVWLSTESFELLFVQLAHIYDILGGYAPDLELFAGGLGQKFQKLIDLLCLLRVAGVLLHQLLVVQLLPLQEVLIIALLQKLEGVEFVSAILEDVQVLLRQLAVDGLEIASLQRHGGLAVASPLGLGAVARFISKKGAFHQDLLFHLGQIHKPRVISHLLVQTPHCSLLNGRFIHVLNLDQRLAVLKSVQALLIVFLVESQELHVIEPLVLPRQVNGLLLFRQ